MQIFFEAPLYFNAWGARQNASGKIRDKLPPV